MRGEQMNRHKLSYRSIESEALKILNCDEAIISKLLAVCVLLDTEIDHYDWVGFYLVGSKPRELLLGPFIGEPTEHVCIPFGKGICGQAAQMKRTIIIQDVAKETKYLACAPDVKAELVVPILKKGEVLGELDIDSLTISSFTWEDRNLLEKICKKLGTLM